MITGIYALVGIYAVAMFIAQVVGSQKDKLSGRGPSPRGASRGSRTHPGLYSVTPKGLTAAREPSNPGGVAE